MKSLNIALIGYGKMGHIIESVAAKHGHKIACIIDNENDWLSANDNVWSNVDVAIEFSTPDTVVANIEKCFELNVPIVVGTTGWNNFADELRKRCEKENLSLFHSSNFSIGVYIFMQTARFISEKIPSQYKPSISETHHIHKLDKPSGTALTLAHKAFDGGVNASGFTADTVPIESIREAEVIGIHSLKFSSDDDEIVLTHNAYSRNGLALGAVKAAEWLVGKHGWFNMEDLMNSR